MLTADGRLVHCPMQVGTSDGRVKIMGQEGVECSIVSLSQAGTQQIDFLPNRGALVRLNQAGRDALLILRAMAECA